MSKDNNDITPHEAVFDPIAALKKLGIQGKPTEIDIESELEKAEKAVEKMEVLELENDVGDGGPVRAVVGDITSTVLANGRDGAADPYAIERAAYAVSGSKEAMRFNTGKPRWDLLPGDALSELVAVYTMGAEKYADRNWEKGLKWTNCFASMMRHSWKWMMGEDLDDESGLHHMAHVAWNALAIVAFFKRRRTDLDDRPTA